MRGFIVLAVAALFIVAAFAPQRGDDLVSRCGVAGPEKASKVFVEGYDQASLALKDKRPRDAIRLANALEPSATSDRQRSSLWSVRQTAYASLDDTRGMLTEAEKLIDLGCLSPEQFRTQTEMAATLRERLGLPPR